MKLFAFSLVLASVGLVAEVAASPIRLELAAVPPSDASPFRLGHAAVHAHSNAAFVVPVDSVQMNALKHHRTHWQADNQAPCPMRAKAKAVQISNWFRQQFGLPLIEAPHQRMHHHPNATRIHSTIHGAIPIIGIPHEHSAGVHKIEVVGVAGDSTPPVHMVHTFHHRRPQSFLGRVHKALMTLGPWEGRVVAFVLGCGIGSLLRMVWVLVVIAIRSVRPQSESTIQLELLYDEEEEQLVEPPKYVADQSVAVQDEKVAI